MNRKYFIIGTIGILVLSVTAVIPMVVANGLPGDFDGDGDRDLSDLMYLVAHWNTVEGDPDWDPRTDFDGDGDCDLVDVMTFVNDYWNVSVNDVDVDIKPGSCPNSLNTKSKGVLSVAVCGTPDFDVTLIDPATVRLENVAPLRWAYEDVATPFDGEPCDCHDLNGDGYLDITFKFDTQELVADIAPVSEGEMITLELTGNLLEDAGAIEFIGQDCVWIKH